MSSWNYKGPRYDQPTHTTFQRYPPAGPYHQSTLGYNVHHNYYDENYTAPRGFCGMPFAFWLWLAGIVFPFFWIIGLCCLNSRNPYERVWAKNILFSLIIYMIIGLVLGLTGGLGWGRRRYY
ncbi:uncharacterized protein EV422DRAFT_522960 [Fimicolochytrium jonesii]|uniref:uncharacterized protein n=1 Tax=Fimicolochytrium jonesii TaxID=1396493 RepID=UPI0022FE08F7|nr:uncharacterized protein EV422DRAFT_522960 [Fimicolochytrium jonesii]KAI8822988.1 hypothetical protein EV422DRAFT_522960 [Fimicolochytrium jonesii]